MPWQTDKSGNIIVCPVTGFQVAPAMGIAVLAKIEFQRKSDQGEITPDTVQLAMTPAIVQKLMADLTQALQDIHGAERPKNSN